MGVAEGPETPIRLFYSYSHRDEELRKKLEDHLAALRWSEMIAEWHDRDIDAGEEWEKEIDRHLSSADIILLLVSASFIASKYCWSVEMTKALERHEKGEAKVIPVILRPCDWRITRFAKLQAAPKDAKPVTSWPDQDDALYDVECKIKRVVAELQQERRRAAEQAQERAEEAPKRAEVRATREAEQRRKVEAETKQERARREVAAPADLAVFRDVHAPWCPELVVLPRGSFLMGLPEAQNEGPQHRVTIGYSFAIGRYVVTFDEFDHFLEPYDNGWGRGRRPVIQVAWNDAKAYCAWLAERTSEPYRLPTEAEWEYACRAGTTTGFSCGDQISPNQANYVSNPVLGFVSIVKRGKTKEVGSYPSNPWGLHDMHGNVWEWVEDCYHESYQGAPQDGSPWTAGECSYRVVRGGSWISFSRDLRSAYRYRFVPTYRDYHVGFRVARTLD